MKCPGIILLCCVLLVKGQEVSDNSTTTTTSGTTTTTATTTKTTTTTEEPTTTTPASTTTPKPSPTPTPTPSPAVPDYPRNIGKWTVEDKETSCIALKGAMQIVISENKTEELNVPPFAIASGSCTLPQQIILSWNSTVPNLENSLSLTFAVNDSKENSLELNSGISAGKYGLQNVEVKLYLNSSNATVEKHLKDVDIFQTPLNHSYSCLAEEVIKSKDGTFTLKIREVQLEAYRLSSPGHHEFSASVQCPADDATDVVPIAVGAALAGLVVLVLIAYLIGRKRSRARGYQSV